MTTHPNSTTGIQLAYTRTTTIPGRIAGPHRGEGVTDMHRFSRRDRITRAWDELSEADRHVLLRAARERRAQQAQRDAQIVEAYVQRLTK